MYVSQLAGHDQNGRADEAPNSATSEVIPQLFNPLLTDLLIAHGAEELKRLYALKAKGWQEEDLDYFFDRQRQMADNADTKLSKIFFERMRGVLREVDSATECVSAQVNLKFLDLGCYPGGFTSYILDKNTKASGLGISLDPTQGGHHSLLQAYRKRRFQILLTDLTYYQLDPSQSKVLNGRKLQCLPFDVRSGKFDLALLDGHFLRTQVSARPWDRHRLAISQIIIGLQAVMHGGTIVIKLSRPESIFTIKIMRLLDTISSGLSTCKPKSTHATRSTFYAVAKGVGHGVDAFKLPDLLVSFKRLWVELTFGGEEGNGRFLDATRDLNFIVDDAGLESFLERQIELCRSVWEVQAATLEVWFEKRENKQRRKSIARNVHL